MRLLLASWVESLGTGEIARMWEILTTGRNLNRDEGHPCREEIALTAETLLAKRITPQEVLVV
jgi:hypothetical protein